MQSVKLRQVGGSVMVAVPKMILEAFALKAGSDVAMSIDDGRIVMEPTVKPRYNLDELLARCDHNSPSGPDDAAWLSGKAVGEELL
jgi:antitoxin ChpS